MRYGGGKAARLSIPRDTLVEHPRRTGRARSTPPTRSAGRPLMIETLKQYLGIEINHIVEVDFKGFPKFVDALGGVNMTFEQLHRVALRGPRTGCGHFRHARASTT